MGFGSGAGNNSISTSSDVSLNTVTSGELLSYDTSTQKWKNRYGGPERVLTNIQTTSYTPTSTDEGKAIEIDSATPTTVTIPVDIFAHGSLIEIVQVGAGQVTIVGATGTSFLPAGTIQTRAQGASVALRRRSVANTWHISGDLA